MHKRVWLYLPVVCVALLVGCSGQSNASPGANTPAREPTAHQEPTTTRTPRPTQTPTVTPMPTQDPIGSLALNPEGPWLTFTVTLEKNYGANNQNLWAMNSDGTGGGMLDTDFLLGYPVPHPEDEALIAYIAREAEDSIPVLKLMRLPSGEITELTPISTSEIYDDEFDREALFITLRFSGLSWSPDGTKLAFLGALDDGSVDVYVYDFATDSVIPVSNLLDYTELFDDGDPSDSGMLRHAYGLWWTPDSQYIFHKSSVDPWGCWVGSRTGIWYARADSTHSVLAMDNSPYGDEALFLGRWGEDAPYQILVQQAEVHGPVAVVNVETDEITEIIYDEDSWIQVAAASHSKTVLIVPSRDGDTSDPLLLYINGALTEIPNEHEITSVRWENSLNAFIGENDQDEQYVISLEGETSEYEPPQSSPSEYLSPDWDGDPWYLYELTSPDGALAAWSLDNSAYMNSSEASALWIGPSDAKPTKLFYNSLKDEEPENPYDNMELYSFRWSPDSQRVILLTNQGIYVAERPDFELVQIGSYDFVRVSLNQEQTRMFWAYP